jgi:TPR repeat protein
MTKTVRKIGVSALGILSVLVVVVVCFLWREKVVERRKLSDAAEQCRRLAEQGNADREFDLARIYFEGKGVTKDYAEALQW